MAVIGGALPLGAAPTQPYHAVTKAYADRLVPNPPVTLTYAATITPDASAGNYRVVTATGDVALAVPTSGTDGQMLRIRVIASGAQRTVTFNGSYKRPATVASTLVIASGGRGDIGLLYENGYAWTVLAATAVV